MSKETTRTYERFPLVRRIEHLVMLLSFSTLGLTGLPQKFSNAGVSIAFIQLIGGIENLRTIHHAAAILLMFGTAWHILVMGYHVFVLRSRMSMLPSLQDVKDGWQVLLYNIGLAKSYPQMGRYTFEEKMEYWAFVWGAIIMGLTGFLMWNPITATKYLPGEFVPAAKAAHGSEALLAVLAIIIWHMYGVHIKRFNKAMWTGKQTEEEMLHEHPLELADIKAGIASRRPDIATIRKRQTFYYPIAAVLTVVMLGGVYGFVSSEQTAITTIPTQSPQIAIYVPQTPTPLPTLPPTPTARPTSAAAPTTTGESVASTTPSWDNGIGQLFQQKCALCHGASGMVGLNLTTYADAMKGSSNGPVIVPGDAANSKLVVKQQAGNHPGQLTADEINQVISWIDAGAPEK
jgi:cytochrome b subunit of formate dehydrogenase/mono/diheme cytochrome c family protein